MPMIFQSEKADCGVASLSMMLRYYGHRIPESNLRKYFPGLSRGTSLKHIADVSSKLGLPADAYHLDTFDDVDSTFLPCVAHWKNSHFVVLVRKSKNTVTINDPSSGTLKLSRAEFDQSFRGYILSFSSSKRASLSITISPVIKDIVSALIGMLKTDIPLVKSTLLLFLLAVLLCVFAMGAPYYGKLVFDSIIGDMSDSGSKMLLLVS